MNLIVGFRKLLHVRRPDELTAWAQENFNVNDIGKISNNEIAKEIRNFNIRYSMYMEGDSDVRRVGLIISVVAVLVSILSLVLSIIAIVSRG